MFTGLNSHAMLALSTLRFQLIGTPQGIEQFTVQLKDTPTEVCIYNGCKVCFSKVPLEVLQNWVLIQLIDMPHFFENVECLIKELIQLIYQVL